MLLSWFCRTCEVVLGSKEATKKEKVKTCLVLAFFSLGSKRSWMLSSGWERTGKNDWEQQDMTPYEFAVGCYRLRSNMFGQIEAGKKELN